MNRRNLPSLSCGALKSIIGNALYNETPILQVLGYKNLQGENNDCFRILISDGKNSYEYGLLATGLNQLISDGKLENFTIIRVKKFVINQVAIKATPGKEQKKIIILLDIEPIVPGSEVGEKIGNPQTLNEGEEVAEEKATNSKPAPQTKKRKTVIGLYVPINHARACRKLALPLQAVLFRGFFRFPTDSMLHTPVICE